jgi:uroporphyrin-III C-methyltransferase
MTIVPSAAALPTAALANATLPNTTLANAAARVQPPTFAPGSVWLVGAGPGDPGLLTLHALHALAQADVVLHDALVSAQILALAAPARLEPVGKRAGGGRTPQLRINERLIRLARQGHRVVRLKGGDPMVFGRGAEEALALAAAGVAFRIVPGISAGIGGTAAAGIATTHRGLAHSVAFVTGHAADGALPADLDWPALARGADVLVLYMALRTIGAIAEALRAGGRAAGEPVAFITEATTPRQSVRITTLADAARTAGEISRGAPTLIVIGPVVALRPLLAGWQQAAPMSCAAADDRPTAPLIQAPLIQAPLIQAPPIQAPPIQPPLIQPRRATA